MTPEISRFSENEPRKRGSEPRFRGSKTSGISRVKRYLSAKAADYPRALPWRQFFLAERYFLSGIGRSLHF